MEHEALVCPVCGAPHREVIPAGVVHVKCRYCGGTIVVPSQAARCPNHPKVLALSSCNDCGRSYCRDCLSVYFLEGETESGALQLCANCLEHRYVKRSEGSALALVWGGVLFLIFGFFILLVEPLVGVLFTAFFALPMLIYGLHKTRKLHREETMNYGEYKSAVEGRLQRTTHEIYHEMLREYARTFGPIHGSILLENRLNSYLKAGISREKAIRKMAEDGGYA